MKKRFLKVSAAWVLLFLIGLPVSAWAQLPVVSLTLDSGVAAESGQVSGSFTVTRTNVGNIGLALVTRVVVDMSQSATLHTDYSGSGWAFVESPNVFNVNIPSGQLSTQVLITPAQDNLIEGEEVLAVTLETDGTTYSLGLDTQAIISIADDPVEVSLTLNDGEAAEAGQDPGSFTVTRTDSGKVNAVLATRVVVDISQSATLHTDFTGQGWAYIQSPNIFQVSILSGQLSAEVSLLPVLDNLVEGMEAFAVMLETDGTTYTLGADTEAAFTIADDPVIVSLTLDDGEAAEVDQDPGSFTVSRSNSGDLFSTLTTVVEVDMSQSATLFTDYTGVGWAYVQNPNVFQVYIPSHELSKTVVITPVFDLNEDEGDETLSVRLVENGDTYSLGANDNIFMTIENLINRVFADSFEQ